MDIAIPRSNGNRLRALRAREDVEREVSRLLGPHRMEAAARDLPRAELFDIALDRGGLLELCYGDAARIDIDGDAAQFLFRLTLAGHCELRAGRERTAVTRGGLSVSSPARASRIETSRDCRSLLLRLDRAALELKLANLLQATPRAPLLFELSVDAAHRGAGVVRDMLGQLCRWCAEPDTAAARSMLGPDLTQWLMTMLLTLLPHSYSDALARGVRRPLPAHVRRARDHADAHLGEPLPLAALARAAGVSPRTLQNGFAQFLQTSPAAYVREQRLSAVHDALLRAPGRSVADVLIEHGVHSFGHFAKAYARRFGHPPSETGVGAGGAPRADAPATGPSKPAAAEPGRHASRGRQP
ncbi:AraC family transcriptional regulator [Burkholderia oklahomensis]|uniref:Helix-turn-helix domain protein n=1 Tax=Burkholderia oklahomensis TaxID=342113 RepID=A0AAI8FSE1_9BURK|nr:AraC family transcriptional regulator [Burkholderia oklahomensis]AIO70995.1 helix-turn-helix domain protein [Burkholderia oklahomensis]AOI38406.1 AraC family transcriptional regulator [Burkholderia oklahomensis EO147]KUY48471.1 AraC family transcriptional regulator [Burkholderia oklahomensis EO147]QPS41248.1 AraC family transcriptional regulator [Burkholderia oklahomensis]